MNRNDSKTNTNGDSGQVLGFLLLRLWLGLRALVTGVEKYAGSASSDAPVSIDGAVNSYGLTATEIQKVYGVEHYHGVPAALYSKLSAEPLVPEFALKLFDGMLGPLLILTGIALLAGIATRISLFVMGLLYCSLTVGLILLKQDAGIAWLGVHILLVVAALYLARYNRFQITKRI